MANKQVYVWFIFLYLIKIFPLQFFHNLFQCFLNTFLVTQPMATSTYTLINIPVRFKIAAQYNGINRQFNGTKRICDAVPKIQMFL